MFSYTRYAVFIKLHILNISRYHNIYINILFTNIVVGEPIYFINIEFYDSTNDTSLFFMSLSLLIDSSGITGVLRFISFSTISLFLF
jgi:hypothetical protein